MLDALIPSRALAQKGAALLTGLLTVVSLCLVPASEVEAKKFGGGMSIGKPAPMKKAPAAPAANTTTPAKPNAAQTPGSTPAGQAAAAPAAAGAGTAAAAGAATRSSWMGPLVGIAAGLGLAALASHLGFGEELMSLLLIGLFVVAAVVIIRLVMARGRAANANATGMPEPAMARSSAGMGGGSMAGGQWSSQPETNPSTASAQGFDRSAGLQTESATYQEPASASAQDISEDDIQAFLNVARQQFMAMQRLWDSGDLSQIESFCTPAMALEIQRQLQERGDAPNQTSVVQLELEWLGLESAQDDDGAELEEAYIRFYGLVREESDGTANGFDEVWLLQKRADGVTGWLLAGITQQGG